MKITAVRVWKNGMVVFQNQEEFKFLLRFSFKLVNLLKNLFSEEEIKEIKTISFEGSLDSFERADVFERFLTNHKDISEIIEKTFNKEEILYVLAHFLEKGKMDIKIITTVFTEEEYDFFAPLFMIIAKRIYSLALKLKLKIK